MLGFLIAVDGQLFTFGAGTDGVLGHGGSGDAATPAVYADITTPTLVDALISERVVDVSVGESHMGAVTASRMLFTWG